MQTTRAPQWRAASPLIDRALRCSASAPAQASAASFAIPVPLPAQAPLPPGPGAGVQPIDEDVRFLMHHATMGFCVPAYAEALALGHRAWLEWQLDWQNIDDSATDLRLQNFHFLTRSNTELLRDFPDPGPLVFGMRQVRVLRAIYSRRQLYERVVEFWTDHFNIRQSDELCQWFKVTDDRDVIRRHALGKFPELLRASAHSPAMMWYLDNYANVAGQAQENYARELQELHTLGVDGPYDEGDVAEVARCFTGWTVRGVDSTDGRPGTFHFDPTTHDYGSKVVLGHTIPAGGGKSDGDFVLELLGTHPSTADYISRKLARWLLSYDPPEHVIQSVVQVFVNTGGDIKAMVSKLLQPEVVARVPLPGRRKVKRPLSLLVGLCRGIGLVSNNLFQLAAQLDDMGQSPFDWLTPDGYPDDAGTWGNSMLPRWEFASLLLGRDILFNEPDVALIQALLDTAPPGSNLSEAIDWILTGGLLDEETRRGVQRYVDGSPMNGVVLRETIALAASSAGYQYY